MDRVNKYTGEVLPWKTISNVDPDEGINKDPGEDLCRLEDFEPISVVINRYLRTSGIIGNEFVPTSEQVEQAEKALDDDLPSDLYDENCDDLMSTQMDLEDYLNSHPAQAVGNDFANGSNNSEKSAEESNNGEEQGGSSVADDDGSQQ